MIESTQEIIKKDFLVLLILYKLSIFFCSLFIFLLYLKCIFPMSPRTSFFRVGWLVYILIQQAYTYVFRMYHRDLDNCICLALRELFFMSMYCTLSHMLGHVASPANGKRYKIKINKDFFMRLLKRGGGRG